MPCDLKARCTNERILPAVREKTFSASFDPQPLENHTSHTELGAMPSGPCTNKTRRVQNSKHNCSKINVSKLMSYTSCNIK